MGDRPTDQYLPRLTDKRCLITGGSRGLGLTMCTVFARAGARVAFTYSRDDECAEDAVRAIAQAATESGRSGDGYQVPVFKGSVADAVHVKATVSALLRTWGGIDVLVNNAAINQIYPLALLEEDDWDQVMDVNVKGPYLFSRAVVKHMIRAKSGHILNIGSFASERMIESPLHYATAKSALRGMTEALAMAVGKHGVTVNLLAPGLLDIGMSTMLPRRTTNDYLAQSAMARLGRAEEVAHMAAYLVSDDNSFMTGAKLVLDGGL